MQRQIITTGFLLLSLIFPLKVLAKDYDNIYVFGDSFSDTGNVFNATNGIIPPDPTYSNGRFSNGPNWVDYLASDLGLTFNLKNNFAFGGATTGTKNIGLATLPGLQQQINNFVAAPADFNALYIIWAGTNDYLSYFFDGEPNPSNTVANLSAALTSLVADGARDIMVVNLPDLGKLPFANFNSQRSNLFNTFSRQHNSSLNTRLQFLSQQLSPDTNIIELNVNSLFNQIIAAPEEFGFTNVTNSCISKDLSVVPINDVPTQQVLCNPEKFLFWDEVHPTTTAHKLIGELAFSALKSVPVPEPSAGLGIVAYSIFGAVSLLRHKIIN